MKIKKFSQPSFLGVFLLKTPNSKFDFMAQNILYRTKKHIKFHWYLHLVN